MDKIEIDGVIDSVTFRKYEKVWQTIAGSAKPVRICVPVARHATFIQAIRKEKTIANTRRKAIGMPVYGILWVKADPARADVLVFHMEHNGDLL